MSFLLTLPRLLRECLAWWSANVLPFMPPRPWTEAPRVLHDRLPHVPQWAVLR